ncbi:MAG: AAA family ATPase [Acidimicrobiales bacterium]
MNTQKQQGLDSMASANLEPVLAALNRMIDQPATTSSMAQPDRRDGSVYRCPPSLLLALKAALVTGRPLLLQGRPGSGKSSIAAYVARNLGWRYYEFVVDARTEPNDLLWRFDLVRRLADAQIKEAGGVLADTDYVEPGVLWWMLDDASARFRGATELPSTPAVDPNDEINRHRTGGGAVLLIDEIDKAEPDVPGGLLVPLGSFRFTVQETGTVIDAGIQQSPRLVIVTTNDDRELPAPFLRRCVVHRLEPPDEADLIEIAKRHLLADGYDPDAFSEEETDLLERLAAGVAEAGQVAEASEHCPSVAEYLDAVRAMRQLGTSLSAEDLSFVESLILRKQENANW